MAPPWVRLMKPEFSRDVRSRRIVDSETLYFLASTDTDTFPSDWILFRMDIFLSSSNILISHPPPLPAALIIIKYSREKNGRQRFSAPWIYLYYQK